MSHSWNSFVLEVKNEIVAFYSVAPRETVAKIPKRENIRTCNVKFWLLKSGNPAKLKHLKFETSLCTGEVQVVAHIRAIRVDADVIIGLRSVRGRNTRSASVRSPLNFRLLLNVLVDVYMYIFCRCPFTHAAIAHTHPEREKILIGWRLTWNGVQQWSLAELPVVPLSSWSHRCYAL